MLPHDSSGNPQDPVTQELTVSANSRETILLNNIAELSSTDVSTKAECTSGESIIVERAMYWYDATGSYWQGGHDCIGVTAPATTWYLAEGNTNVFDEYVLVQNPNTTTATVTMTYMLPLDSEGNPQDPITHQINISPNSRETIHVNQIAGLESTDVSTKAQCTSGEGIITERSMYWSNTSLYPDPMSAYSFLRSDYYRDGTLKICPAVSASSETVDSITFILKKLDHTDDSISFNSTEYVVYSAVPDYMTISQAYQTNFDGAVSTLSTAASGLSSSPVLIANNNHESAKYYIPNFPNGTNDHTGLTENIIWSIDEYDGLPSTISTKVAQAHMVQYGWAFDPTKKIAAISWQHLAADGGSVTTAPSTILLIVTNHVLQIFTHDYIVDTITGLIGGDYPFPDPAKHWLQQGAFMCYQPGPGFQSNLLRRYTPWGAWNLLNNTSGLFVKADGTVEIPAANTSTPYPLVTQTWDENQRFCIINNLDKTVYGVNDLYPGDENYLIGNSYLPEKAGLITAWKYYPRMYYPQDTTRVDERDSDGWLGLRGDPPEYTMAWNDADNTEPGGQARKPYMMGAGIKHGSNGDQYIFRFEHSNSFLVARGPDPSSEENKLYKATIYVDQGAGAGYQSLGSITYEWQNWNVSTTGTPLWEAGSGSGYWVPQQVSLSSTITDVSVICNRASAWDSTNVITWETTTFSSQQNALGGNVYRFRVEGDTTNANMKFLVVLEDLS